MGNLIVSTPDLCTLTYFGTIEVRTHNEIKHNTSDMKTEIIESLQTNLESLVDSRTKDLEDKTRRETTLFFLNVPEHRYPRAEDNKMQDMEYIQIFEVVPGS